MAATQSAQDRMGRAREVLAKAEAAYAEAEQRLGRAQERGWDVGILRERLRDLRTRLDEIDGEARQAA